MILEAIFNVLFFVFNTFISLFNLPDMPAEIVSVLDEYFWPYIEGGLDFVTFFIARSVLIAFITFRLTLFAVDKGISLFSFIWKWIRSGQSNGD